MILLMIAAIAVIAMIMRAIAARNAPQVIQSYPANGTYNQPGFGSAPYPAAPQAGGGLATGAALGTGMVAGEALAHHFIDGNKTDATPTPPPQDGWNERHGQTGFRDHRQFILGR